MTTWLTSRRPPILSIAGLNQQTESAKKETAQLFGQNQQLAIDLSKEQTIARKAEAGLQKQNEETSRYSHALAVQQQTIAQQIHTSPELTTAQVEAIANALTPFGGQEVIMHRTEDTVVGRLGASIATAFNTAHIKIPSYSIDMGQLYQGVTIAVHADKGHPPLADVLLNALRQQGIVVTPVSLDTVPEGRVALFLGPQ
jgi:hypothetical protein